MLNDTKQYIRLAVVTAICLAHLAFGLFANPSGQPVDQLVRYLQAGIELSQPLLLAVVATLGPFALVKQFPAAAIGVILLATAAELHSNFGPTQVMAEILVVLMMFSVLLVPLGVARRLGGLRVTLPVFATEPASGRNQFSIAWLFMITIAAAVSFAVLHYAIDGRQANPDSFRWLELMVVVAALALLLLGAMLFVDVMLARRGKRYLALACLVLIPTACGLAAEIVTYIAPARVTFQEALWEVVEIECGILVSIAATLLPLRWCGYRLVHHGQQCSPMSDA